MGTAKRKTAFPVTVSFNPEGRRVELYGHQKEALEKFKDRDEIALFFEMGCGKTGTTLKIAEYKYRHGMIEGLLVVAPNDVHRQWYDDLVRPAADPGALQWLEVDFEAQCVGGRGGQKELYPFQNQGMFQFVSVNVDTFSTPEKWKPVVEWANSRNIMIAIDEATVIKNPDSKRSKRLLYQFNRTVKRGRTVLSSVKLHPVRAVLTGTPVTNGPVDLWAIMEFVRPNYFCRNYWSFRQRYGMYTQLAVTSGFGSVRTVDVPLTERTWFAVRACSSYEEARITFGCTEDTYMTVKHQAKFEGPYKHADELKVLLEPVAMFRKLTDCVDMPPVNYVLRETGMSEAQEKAYRSMKRDLIAEYGGYSMSSKNKLVLSIRLQQISSGFIMGQRDMPDCDGDFLDGEWDLAPDEVVWLGESNPKLDALMRDVAEADKPLLILTRYSAEAAKIYDLCKEQGYRTGLFTGWKVLGGVDAFKAGELDVLVANSAKIARGFNLQVAHTTLFFSNTFSMEVRQQAEFRTFRIGQKEPCLYIDYACSEIDRTITKALQQKKGLLDYIRERDIEEAV